MNRFSMIVLRIFFFFSRKYKLRVHYASRLPRKGPVVLVPKHQKGFDIPVMSAATGRPIQYMAKEELFKNFFFRLYLLSTGAFPVRQNTADRKALKTAGRKLARRTVVGIFAEGTRIPGNAVGPVEAGLTLAVSLSKVDCLIVPTGVCYRTFGDRTVIDVHYGEPFYLEECGNTKEERLAGVRNRMQAVQDLACSYPL